MPVTDAFLFPVAQKSNQSNSTRTCAQPCDFILWLWGVLGVVLLPCGTRRVCGCVCVCVCVKGPCSGKGRGGSHGGIRQCGVGSGEKHKTRCVCIRTGLTGVAYCGVLRRSLQAMERIHDPWYAAEMGNLPIVRRAVDMGTIGVHEVNPTSGETLLHVSFPCCGLCCAPLFLTTADHMTVTCHRLLQEKGETALFFVCVQRLFVRSPSSFRCV